MERKKSPIKLVDAIVARPTFGINYREKAIYAEPTGKGNLLIIEGYFGRQFRSDQGCVDEELDKYSEMYRELCRQYDEDPAHEFYEVLAYNELYFLHGLIPNVAGGDWGYTNTPDYRIEGGIEFDRRMVTEGIWREQFGEDFYYYCPKAYCVPDACYLEV